MTKIGTTPLFEWLKSTSTTSYSVTKLISISFFPLAAVPLTMWCPCMTSVNSNLHLIQWQEIKSTAKINLHSTSWDRSLLLKKLILRAPSLWFYYEASLFIFSLAVFFLYSHIFQVLSPSFIFNSPSLSLSLTALRHFSSPSNLSTCHFSLCHLAWKIFILSHPCPVAKTLTFCSFSSL